MHNRRSYIVLKGRITAEGPISITLPTAKAGTAPTTEKAGMFPTMPVRIGDAMVRVPIIPSTSLRGPLRRGAVNEIIEGLGPDADGAIGLSRDDYQFLAIGGIKGKATDAGGRDIHLARDILEKNTVAALFGTGEIFTEGLLCVKEARLEGSFDLVEVTDVKNSVRRDDLVRDPELLARFSTKDIEKQGRYVEASKDVAKLRKEDKDLKKQMAPLLRRKETLDAEERERLDAILARSTVVRGLIEGRQTDPSGDFKEQANTLYGYPAVAAGSTFSHMFRLNDPTPLETGLFFAALRQFSRDCTIGGKVNVGCGEVSMTYEMHRHDGVTVDAVENPVETMVGSVSVRQDEVIVDSTDPFIVKAIADWRACREARFPGLDFSLPTRAKAVVADDEIETEAA